MDLIGGMDWITLLHGVLLHRVRIRIALVSEVAEDLLHLFHVEDGQRQKDNLRRIRRVLVLSSEYTAR